MKATFAAGCFWGVEAAFNELPGVIDTTVGYSGGHFKNPSYQDVCSGKTGHAEVVLVEFDPQKISYETLLDTFWQIHDPTTLNRQGPDVGEQYRSAIFFHSLEQEMLAKKSKEKLQQTMPEKIVTEIKPAAEFFTAEEYHQKYFKKHDIVCHVKRTQE